MNTKLKAILLLGALSVSALNVFAASVTITEDTAESDKSYDDSDTTGSALTVINGVTYSGTNITLSSAHNFYEGNGGGAYSSGYLSLIGGSISASGECGSGVVIYGSGTLNNVNIVAEGFDSTGVTVAQGTMFLTGGSINNYGSSGYGIWLVDQSRATLNNANIKTEVGVGIMMNNSTLTMTDSDISATGAGANALAITNASLATVNLNNNTLTGNILATDGSTITLTGSNGSVITGDVRSAIGATIDITLTGANTALHGNFSQDTNTANVINLTLGAGALLHGSGELDNLTLASGAIIGYAGNVLLVTDSISIGDGITIDFSNLTETGEYTVFDWSGATGGDSINAGQFNVAADTGIEGTFSVAGSQLTFNATAVPEPSTWFLIGAGLGALALIRRRSS